jgi:hypothetical protein
VLWQQRWLVVAGCCCELLRTYTYEHLLLREDELRRRFHDQKSKQKYLK